MGTPLTSKISNTSDERTRLMGNIINDVGGTTDWSGLTEIKFDSGYEIKCSSLDTTVTGTFDGIHTGTYNNVKGFIRKNESCIQKVNQMYYITI